MALINILVEKMKKILFVNSNNIIQTLYKDKTFLSINFYSISDIK